MNLRHFALLIPLALASTAHAADVGYVDMSKAIYATQDGKKAKDDLEAEIKIRQANVNFADADAKHAASSCLKLAGAPRAACDAKAAAAQDEADRTGRENEQFLQQKKTADATRISQRLIRIVPAIGAVHHLERVENSTGAVWISPKADYTAELIKRYDAGEGKSEDQVAAELRDKNIALEAKVAALEKEKVAALEKEKAAKATLPAPAVVATKGGAR